MITHNAFRLREGCLPTRKVLVYEKGAWEGCLSTRGGVGLREGSFSIKSVRVQEQGVCLRKGRLGRRKELVQEKGAGLDGVLSALRILLTHAFHSKVHQNIIVVNIQRSSSLEDNASASHNKHLFP